MDNTITTPILGIGRVGRYDTSGRAASKYQDLGHSSNSSQRPPSAGRGIGTATRRHPPARATLVPDGNGGDGSDNISENQNFRKAKKTENSSLDLVDLGAESGDDVVIQVQQAEIRVLTLLCKVVPGLKSFTNIFTTLEQATPQAKTLESEAAQAPSGSAASSHIDDIRKGIIYVVEHAPTAKTACASVFAQIRNIDSLYRGSSQLPILRESVLLALHEPGGPLATAAILPHGGVPGHSLGQGSSSGLIPASSPYDTTILSITVAPFCMDIVIATDESTINKDRAVHHEESMLRKEFQRLADTSGLSVVLPLTLDVPKFQLVHLALLLAAVKSLTTEQRVGELKLMRMITGVLGGTALTSWKNTSSAIVGGVGLEKRLLDFIGRFLQSNTAVADLKAHLREFKLKQGESIFGLCERISSLVSVLGQECQRLVVEMFCSALSNKWHGDNQIAYANIGTLATSHLDSDVDPIWTSFHTGLLELKIQERIYSGQKGEESGKRPPLGPGSPMQKGEESGKRPPIGSPKQDDNSKAAAQKAGTSRKPCSFCKKSGHLEADCWFKEENKGKRPADFKFGKKGNSDSKKDTSTSAGVAQGGIAEAVDLDAEKVLLVSGLSVSAGGISASGLTAFVDSGSQVLFISRRVATRLGLPPSQSHKSTLTLNGPTKKEQLVENFTIHIGEGVDSIQLFVKEARLRQDMIWDADLLIPNYAFQSVFDQVRWNKSNPTVTIFSKGNYNLEAKWINRSDARPQVALIVMDQSTPVEVTTIVESKFSEMESILATMDAELHSEVEEVQELADTAAALLGHDIFSDLNCDDIFSQANNISDHHQRLQAYIDIFRNWKMSGEAQVKNLSTLVDKYQSLIFAHFERDKSTKIPPAMNSKVDFKHNINSSKPPVRVRSANCGMPGSPKYEAAMAKIASFADAGLLSSPIPLNNLGRSISVLAWKPVLKDESKPFSADNTRLTVGGHRIADNILWENDPGVVRRDAPLQVLVNATTDSDGPSEIFMTLDLRDGYLQGSRMDPARAQVAMLDPCGTTARLLLGPIYGYPNAGIHFDQAICQSLSPTTVAHGYVDDWILGRRHVLKFLEAQNDILQELLDNGNVISIKKYRVTQVLKKFGAVLSKKGMFMDMEILEDLVKIPVPKNLEEFKSASHRLLYFGSFLPKLTAAINTISDYMYGKTPKPSTSVIANDWESVMNIVRNHITRNHFDPKLKTILGLDWSETGEFYIMFQVKEPALGDAAVHIITHSQRVHKTKYERTMPAFTGELGNLVRGLRECEQMLSQCIEKPIVLMDCEPIVTAASNNFRSIMTTANKKCQRVILDFLDIWPAMRLRFVHIKREFNPICDYYSYLPHYTSLMRRVLNATDSRPGQVIASLLPFPTGEGTKTSSISLAGFDHESGSNLNLERIKILEEASDKDPTDEFALLLQRVTEEKDINVTELEDILHEDDYKDLIMIVKNPKMVDFKFGRFLVRGELYVPPKDRFESIKKAHSVPEAGHFAFATTMNNLQGLYWPGKAGDVESFIALCGPCDRENRGPKKVNARPNPTSYPFEKITIDFKPAGADESISGFIVITDNATGTTMIKSTESRETANFIRMAQNWMGTYGPFDILVSDREPAIMSKAFEEFAIRNNFVVRPTSPFNKSNGVVEAKMKLINWYLAKFGGDQKDLSQIAPLLTLALNSRCRFRIAGLFFNPYGLIRGFYSRSLAERNAGLSLEHIVGQKEFNMIDWIVDAAALRGEYLKQNFERRGIPFTPEDMPNSEFPEKYPIGTKVWVSTKALPSEVAGTRKTSAKGTGPYEIVSWEPSGMTAELRDVDNPEKTITRNIRFFYPVLADEKSAISAKEYSIEEIIGERYKGNSKKPSKYLVHLTGYGAENAEWISVENINADELVKKWTDLPRSERKRRTQLATEKQANVNAVKGAELHRVSNRKRKQKTTFDI